METQCAVVDLVFICKYITVVAESETPYISLRTFKLKSHKKLY